MPYASNGKISQSPIDGGIEITQEQYQEALIGILSGLEITVDDGFKVAPKPEPVVPEPPLPDVHEVKAAKLAEINADFEASISVTKNGYPLSEMLSWDKQEKEARAYLADANASTPFIDALCAARDVPKAELVARVIAKVEAAEEAVGAATGKRQRLEDQLYAIADDDPDVRTKIDAISWDAS